MDAAKKQNAPTRGQPRSDLVQSQNSSSRPPTPQTPGSCGNCRILQFKAHQLEAELELKSRDFSEAVARIMTNQQAKARAEQLNEKFVEQCVRAKTESQLELKRQSALFDAKVKKIKIEAQKKIDELVRRIKQLQGHLAGLTENHKKQVDEIIQNARHDAVRYEQIINRLKAESSRKIEAAVAHTRQEYSTLTDKVRQLEKQNLQFKQEFQKHLSKVTREQKQKSQAHEQKIAHLKQQYEEAITSLNKRADQALLEKDEQIAGAKEQLTRVGDKIIASAREKSRAEQLNKRLLEQCRMAKAGADVEIELQTREITENMSRLKGQAAAKLQSFADHNAKLKAQARQAVNRLKDHADALNRANVRIKSLEQALAELKNSTVTSLSF